MTRALETAILCLGVVGLCAAAALAGVMIEKAMSNIAWTMQEYGE